MDKLFLEVKERELLGKKVKSLRKDGFLPAVVYGHKFDSHHLTIAEKEFEKVYKEAGGNTVVELKKPEEGKKINVLIHDVSVDPITRKPIHVDFYRVKMDEKITTRIPIKVIGESKAVKELDGMLITNRDEIEVECLPGDLIHEIEVDISVLEELESSIHINDLKVPSTIKVLDEPEEAVLTVEPPRSEEEMAELEEPVEGEVPPEEAEIEAKEGEEQPEEKPLEEKKEE